MHNIAVSLIGVAVTDVRHGLTTSGIPIARFRMVSQPRRYDAATSQFVDLDPSFLTVVAWRSTADHIASSIHRGDPVVVVGRMRVREYEVDGTTRVTVEVDAQSVGHDLSRGTARFVRPPRPAVDGGPESQRDGRADVRPLHNVAGREPEDRPAAAAATGVAFVGADPDPQAA